MTFFMTFNFQMHHLKHHNHLNQSPIVHVIFKGLTLVQLSHEEFHLCNETPAK